MIKVYILIVSSTSIGYSGCIMLLFSITRSIEVNMSIDI